MWVLGAGQEGRQSPGEGGQTGCAYSVSGSQLSVQESAHAGTMATLSFKAESVGCPWSPAPGGLAGNCLRSHPLGSSPETRSASPSPSWAARLPLGGCQRQAWPHRGPHQGQAQGGSWLGHWTRSRTGCVSCLKML